MRRLIAALALTALSTSAGCFYTHITEPLDVHFNATPAFETDRRGDVKHFRYFVVDLQWDSNAIGQIAQEHGIDEVYYADIETLRVWRVWSQTWVHIYGK